MGVHIVSVNRTAEPSSVERRRKRTNTAAKRDSDRDAIIEQQLATIATAAAALDLGQRRYIELSKTSLTTLAGLRPITRPLSTFSRTTLSNRRRSSPSLQLSVKTGYYTY